MAFGVSAGRHFNFQEARKGGEQAAFLRSEFLVPRLSAVEGSDNSISRKVKDIAIIHGLVGYLAQPSDCVFMSNDNFLPKEGTVIKFLEDIVLTVQS
jgi:hypothetical protein